VYDLESTNGTFLNSRPFREGARIDSQQGCLLRLGGVLHLGGVRLRLGTPSRVEAGWLAWEGGQIGSMARHADQAGDFAGLPVLADALEEAGCTDADLLAHCRSGGGHLRGCWAVDLLLGRA
jgi:pSer/pThr/pTyr-binding forkhead associated (FHA) protein